MHVSLNSGAQLTGKHAAMYSAIDVCYNLGINKCPWKHFSICSKARMFEGEYLLSTIPYNALLPMKPAVCLFNRVC